MLESEAKKRVCPFMCGGYRSVDTSYTILKAYCIGSECMKWKTTGEKYVGESNTKGICSV